MTTKEDHEPLTAAARDVARSLTALGAIQRATHGLRDCKGQKALDAAHEITKHVQSARECLLGLSASLERARNVQGKAALPQDLKRARGALHHARQRLERFGFGDAAAAPLADVLEALEALGDPWQGSAARGAGEPAPAGGGSAPKESAAELLGRIQHAVAELCARIERTENALNGTPSRERHKCVINAQVVLDHLQLVACILSEGLDGLTLANNPGGVPKPEGLRATARVLEAVAETIENRDFAGYVKANQAMAAHLAQPCEYLEVDQVAGWPSILRGVQ